MSDKALKGIFALSAIVAGAFSSAYVLPRLWLWFMVPLGLPELGWAALFGIQTTLAVLRPREMRKGADLAALDDLIRFFGFTVGSVWIAYFVGLGWRYFL